MECRIRALDVAIIFSYKPNSNIRNGMLGKVPNVIKRSTIGRLRLGTKSLCKTRLPCPKSSVKLY